MEESVQANDTKQKVPEEWLITFGAAHEEDSVSDDESP